ncbi:ATP-dependent DNA helicase [soil metagenome]
MVDVRRGPTDEQLAVIKLPAGPARVLAGAGSGKTYTMTELVRNRVDDHLRGYGGTPPERVLALTFTVKAAEEMKRRLLDTLKEQALKLAVSNFHSYALDVVRENDVFLGLEAEAPVLRRGRAWMMVIDELGAEDLSLGHLDLGNPATAADRVLTLLSRAKNDLVDLEELRLRTEEDLGRATDESMIRCFEERLDLLELATRFEVRREELGFMRYEEMLELGARVLADPAMGSPYRGRYDLIVVDEFQDTNPAQLRFVELLCGGDLSKVVVIGDDLQSIFAFTGAEIRNIQRFEQTAGVPIGGATYKLSTNFRSASTILALANHVAREVHPENSPDEPKVLAPRPDAPDGDIRAFASASDTEEAEEIARRIKELTETGVSPGSCAVLIRRRSQTPALLAALDAEGVPCEIADAGDLLSRPEITLLSDYLRLAASPNRGGTSLINALLRHPILLDENDLRAVLEHPGGPQRAVADPGTTPNLSDRGQTRLLHFAGVLDNLEGAMGTADSLGDFVERAVEVLGLGHELRSSPDPDARIALQYLAIFTDVAREFGDVRHLDDLLRYLEVVTASNASEFAMPPSEYSDAVRVTTVHRAKCLEFDHVFIPGLSEGVFPTGNIQDSALEKAEAIPTPIKRDPDPELAAAYDALDEKETKNLLKREALAEEGRLFYVACTRAAESLTLSRAHYYTDNRRTKKPSAFWSLLEEAPEECAISYAPEPEAPDTNPNLGELEERELSEPDQWPLSAMAPGEDAEVADYLRVSGWEDDLAGLKLDARNIPEVPRPEHILPPPRTHSPTTLMDYETCPRRYYYTHVFQVPALDPGMEGAQDHGNAVHAYREAGMRGARPDTQPTPPAPDAQPADRGRKSTHGPSKEELWEAFEASTYGRRAAEYPLYEGPEPPKYGPARMVEVPFALEVDGREVRGRIDALFVDEDGAFHLVDWKTGYPYESYKKRLQLPLYALAANRLWGIEPERIRLAYAFVPGDAVVEVDTTEGFLERAEDSVRDAMDRIQAGRFEPIPSRYACSHCPVMGIVIEGCPSEVPEE